MLVLVCFCRLIQSSFTYRKGRLCPSIDQRIRTIGLICKVTREHGLCQGYREVAQALAEVVGHDVGVMIC